MLKYTVLFDDDCGHLYCETSSGEDVHAAIAKAYANAAEIQGVSEDELCPCLVAAFEGSPQLVFLAGHGFLTAPTLGG